MKKMGGRRNNSTISQKHYAVSEIVGMILLLALAISVISVFYMQAMSYDDPVSEPNVTLLGRIESGNIFIEHIKGDSLPLDTQIRLLIAGNIEKLIEVKDILASVFYQDGFWNIGETAVYNEFDLTDVRVECTILDQKTNSLLLWGTLQEGYIVPPFGRGGLWHFDESSWSGTEYDVKDSSGNNNHGKAYGEANTVDHNVNGQTNKSGFFNYLEDGNDFVIIPDNFSLDITNQITIEAWVHPFSFEGNIKADLENKFGYTPYIIKRDEGIFIVVSNDQGKDGIIQTFSISSYGEVSNEPINETYFYYSTGQSNIKPIIYPIIDNIYVVAFLDTKNHITLKTFNISSDGNNITFTGNSLTFNDSLQNSKPNRASIIRVSEGVFAFAYRINTDTNSLAGIIRMVNISDTGSFSDYEYNVTFDDDGAYEPSIINIPSYAFAIVYRNINDQGILKRFEISNNNINFIGPSEIFDYNRSFEPSIINIEGDVFAIAYRNEYDQGIIKRYKISKDYIVEIGSAVTFEASSCFNPCLINLYNNNYIIVYSKDEGGQPDGFYKSIEIKDDGTIIHIGSRKIFDTTCKDPLAIRISDRIFGVVYEGAGNHLGKLKTIHPEFTSDLYSSGICKYGSYGIFFNSTLVSGNINKITINASMPNSGLFYPWHHIALTYNGEQMILYLDGEPKNPRYLSQEIKITKSNLTFGEFFYGYLDEIALFDRPLTPKEVKEHYENPGFF